MIDYHLVGLIVLYVSTVGVAVLERAVHAQLPRRGAAPPRARRRDRTRRRAAGARRGRPARGARRRGPSGCHRPRPTRPTRRQSRATSWAPSRSRVVRGDAPARSRRARAGLDRGARAPGATAAAPARRPGRSGRGRLAVVRARAPLVGLAAARARRRRAVASPVSLPRRGLDPGRRAARRASSRATRPRPMGWRRCWRARSPPSPRASAALAAVHPEATSSRGRQADPRVPAGGRRLSGEPGAAVVARRRRRRSDRPGGRPAGARAGAVRRFPRRSAPAPRPTLTIWQLARALPCARRPTAPSRPGPSRGRGREAPTRTPIARQRVDLSGAAKDRAEHVMIVDLERNDLGRVCHPGSVDGGVAGAGRLAADGAPPRDRRCAAACAPTSAWRRCWRRPFPAARSPARRSAARCRSSTSSSRRRAASTRARPAGSVPRAISISAIAIRTALLRVGTPGAVGGRRDRRRLDPRGRALAETEVKARAFAALSGAGPAPPPPRRR